mgnify:CR=1 FL=1
MSKKWSKFLLALAGIGAWQSNWEIVFSSKKQQYT